MKIVYKVIRIKSGHKASVRKYGKGSLRYFLSKWTKPTIPKSKIFVFDKMTDAFRFCRRGSNEQIWEAVTPKVYDLNIKTGCYTDSFKYMSNLWKNPEKISKKLRDQHYIPRGTRFCDQLKLVKRIL